MKKIFLVVGLAIVFSAVSAIPNVPLSTISNAVLGALVGIIFGYLDTHGKGLKIWFQSQIKYRNKTIRLSFSYLFRIQVDGQYLLVRGKRLPNQFQPVGGVYKYYDEAKPALEKLNFVPDTQIGNGEDIDDLRLKIKGKHLLSFLDWFSSMFDREYDPIREFNEELLQSGILPQEVFSTIAFRKVGVYKTNIQFSKYMGCHELLYSDIFELKPNVQQLEALRKLKQSNSQNACFASDDEIARECASGIEKNLGTNSGWILLGRD